MAEGSLAQVLIYCDGVETLGLSPEQMGALETVNAGEFVHADKFVRPGMLESAFVRAGVSYAKNKLMILSQAIVALLEGTSVTVSVELGAGATGNGNGLSELFADIDEALAQAVSARYDLAQVAEFGLVIKTMGLDIGGLPEILRNSIKTEGRGLGLVKNPALQELLVNWMNVDPRQGGQVHNPLTGKTIQVVALSRRQEIWEQLLRLIRESSLDRVLEDVAKYQSSFSKSDMAKRIGQHAVADTSSMADPAVLGQEMEGLFAEITALMERGIVGPTRRIISAEQDGIVLTALLNAGVVTSLGTMVGPGENPLGCLLRDPKNPHKLAIASIKLYRTIAKCFEYMATYNPKGDLNQFFLGLGTHAQQYSLATREFASASPEPPRDMSGFMGIANNATSFMAALRVSLSIDREGVKVTVQAEVATTSQVPVEKVDRRLLRVLMIEKLADRELRTICTSLKWSENNNAFDYEELGSSSKSGKVLDLIQLADRRSAMEKLLATLGKERNDVTWYVTE